MKLNILFRDEHLVVVDKPSGLLVHRSGLDHFEVRFALQMVRDQIGQHVYPVHRLDKPTSGALMFGLTGGVAAAIGAQFRAGDVEKTYLCIVRGVPPNHATIDYPLRPADAAHGVPQEARTEIRRLASCELDVVVDKFPTSRYSLVEAKPRTGRTHQIRRHLRHLGHPIVGDVTYGVGKHNRFFGERFGFRRLMLACTELKFRHPALCETVSVKAPLADEFRRVVSELGWSEHAAP